jgi:DNA-binding NtrC family response regulator
MMGAIRRTLETVCVRCLGSASVSRPSIISTLPAAAPFDDADFHLPQEGLTLYKIEHSSLRQALTRSGGNVTRAAELLGITRDTLRYRLKKMQNIGCGGKHGDVWS